MSITTLLLLGFWDFFENFKVELLALFLKVVVISFSYQMSFVAKLCNVCNRETFLQNVLEI